MGKFQPFLDLPASQFVGLVDDVAKRGVLLPILVDENGDVLDGHQRRKAAAEAGVECPCIVIEGLTDEEKHTLALTLNLYRRHLSGTERTKALQQLANLGMSTRRMADLLGISKSTVHNDLKALSNSGQWQRPDTVTGADGRDQPSTKPEREHDEPPVDVDENGERVQAQEPTPLDSDTATSGSDAAGLGDDEQDEDEDDGPSTPASSPAPKVAPNPTLKLIADFSGLRAEVGKWLAFDRHEQVIESMSQEQRDDYRRFCLSVFNHASATLDLLDAPARLKAVQ